MYYPLLRGRQNELLALQELLKDSRLGSKVVPIIEPVKLSATFINTLELFIKNKREIVVIVNPKVGSFVSECSNSKNKKYYDRFKIIMNSGKISCGFYVDKKSSERVNNFIFKGIDYSLMVAICLTPDDIQYYEESIGDKEVRTLVPYSPTFRRINISKILLNDNFIKRNKNAEYEKYDGEFFSEDHIYYDKENYIGFSDYSIIGAEYIDSGFAPYAVAIHIVYMDEKGTLKIKHFVSDDNDDISDPANKYYQAVTKMHKWNINQKYQTLGILKFEDSYQNQTYPGLGVVKKLSIMHHIELIGEYLDKR